MASFVAFGLLALGAVLLLLKGQEGAIAGLDSDSFGYMILGLALLVFVGSGLFSGYRGRVGDAVRDAGTWAVIALALVIGYSYREELTRVAERVASELAPGMIGPVEMTATGDRSVRIRRQLSNHFVASVTVNGIKTKMVVDTGASTIVLRSQDALRAGVNLAKLTYSVPVQTANGISTAARLKLDAVSVGPVTLRNVETLIARPGALHQSLLGMSFLSRLRSYEFTGDFLTLRG